ncbi:RsmB/NOP family class I SAM-dependent RNA methyltransferase [Pelagibius sp. Alg239-R121]|uniref:RsmB/NOP family class I SAM-dependent RNA methyltransferase n=1 Tax=Pelagibius sp. Alg239-R121 TaxID=2993448 RepID=UPI0024A6BD0C|nr:RsmB/NOP family class I SAM-dependent RNA methyltransferase [Pelagibius sp. Alg239-R121]
MRPGARIGAVIEILEDLEARAVPADRVVTAYTRSRRYVGSKDRREIGDLTYSALRTWLRVTWWLERTGCAEATTRARLLAVLVLAKKMTPEDLEMFFDGEGYGPSRLTADEQSLIAALSGAGLEHPEQPAWVRDEVAPWLHGHLQARFSEDMAVEMSALQQEAEVVLRVNSLKGDRASAQNALAKDSVETHETRISPIGLRVEGRRALQASGAFRDGLIEVQDEGSQLIALLCDVQPGMAVADYCAGAGGKTLGLAANMKSRGRLVALDLDGERLRRAVPRLERAGVGAVEQRRLPDNEWVRENAGTFDRVLVDAPCSGSGVWRRQPDARLALTPERLQEYLTAQTEVMQAAAGLVRPGGRLIYATCSLLQEEDEAQVEAFLKNNDEFTQCRISDVWASVLPEVACPTEEAHLLLTPHKHGTDGFFVSVLERRAGG